MTPGRYLMHTLARLVLCVVVGLSLVGIVVSQAGRTTKVVPDPGALLTQGIAKARSGDYKGAIEDFDHAIQMNPQYAEAYYHRGIVRNRISWIPTQRKPIEDFEAAVKLNPKSAEANFELGRAKEEISYLDLAIALNPSLAEAYYWRGHLRGSQAFEYLEQIRSGQAAHESHYLFRVLKIPSQNPDEVVAHLSEMIRTAIEDYNTAVRLKPDYTEVYLARGWANFNSKDYRAAIDDFTRVVEVWPKHSEAYEKRGLAALELGDQEKALKDFIQVIKLATAERQEWSPFAVMTRRRQKEQYTSHLEKLTNSPKLAEAFYAEGMAYRYVLQQPEKAIASFTRAIQLNLSTADVFYQRGLVFAAQLKTAGAIEDFTRAIQFNPRDPDYYYSRGAALFDARDYRKAIADFTEAIRISSKIAYVQYRRGRAYYALGDKQNAIADFTAALKSNSQLTESYYWRGLAFEDTGDKQRAIADYIKVTQNSRLDKDGDTVDIARERFDAQIHIYRGVARLALANGAEPEEFYGSPGYLRAYDELAAYRTKAIEDFSLAIQSSPNSPEAYYWRARAQRWRWEGGQTIADLNKAIILKPDFVHAYLERARISNAPEAIKDLNEVVHLKPHWAVAYYERGLHYVYRTPTENTTRSAFANLTRAIEINRAFSEAYMQRGSLRSDRLKDFRGALRDFTTALRLTPDDVQVYSARANLRLEIKDYRGAVKDLDRTIELASGATLTTRTGLALMYESRSLARYELGDGLGSYEDQRRARQLFVYCDGCGLSSDLAKAKKADSFFQKGLSLSSRGDNRGAKWNFGEAARLYHAAGNMSKYQNARYQLSKL